MWCAKQSLLLWCFPGIELWWCPKSSGPCAYCWNSFWCPSSTKLNSSIILHSTIQTRCKITIGNGLFLSFCCDEERFFALFKKVLVGAFEKYFILENWSLQLVNTSICFNKNINEKEFTCWSQNILWQCKSGTIVSNFKWCFFCLRQTCQNVNHYSNLFYFRCIYMHFIHYVIPTRKTYSPSNLYVLNLV